VVAINGLGRRQYQCSFDAVSITVARAAFPTGRRARRRRLDGGERRPAFPRGPRQARSVQACCPGPSSGRISCWSARVCSPARPRPSAHIPAARRKKRSVISAPGAAIDLSTRRSCTASIHTAGAQEGEPQPVILERVLHHQFAWWPLVTVLHEKKWAIVGRP